jgi:hypothetical protein
MAKIWIPAYTKPDGTKVKGHYREMAALPSSAKSRRALVGKIRAGMSPAKASGQIMMQSIQPSRTRSGAKGGTAKAASRAYARDISQRGITSYTKMLAKKF